MPNFLGIIVVMIASNVCWANPLLEIRHGNLTPASGEIPSVDFVFDHLALDEQEYSLIGSERPRSYRTTLDESLEMSRTRRVKGDLPKLMDGLWKVFENRFKQLEQEGSQEFLAQLEKKSPYDPSADIYGPSNPVQQYLKDQMDFSAYDSYGIYKSMQTGYLLGGLPGAKLGFDEFLLGELSQALYLFGSSFGRYQEAKKVELSDQLLGAGAQKGDAVAPFVEGLLQKLRTAPQDPTSVNFVNLLKSANINLEDHAQVRNYLLDAFDGVLKNGSPIVSNILRGSLPINRIRDAIQHENERNEGHYNGPKTNLAKVHEYAFNILRIWQLLGHSFSDAKNFVNFILQHIEELQKQNENQRLDWALDSYASNQTLSCRNLLK